MRVHIRGRVQGVGFRAHTQSRARALALGGSVANLPDGSVEALFEGPRKRVESMVEWCRRGPHGAAVEGIDVESQDLRGEQEFHIEFAQRPGG